MENFEQTNMSTDITPPTLEGEYIPAGVSESTAVGPFENGELVPLSGEQVPAVINTPPQGENDEALVSDEENIDILREEIKKAFQGSSQEREVAAWEIPVGYVAVSGGFEGKDCVMVNGVKYCKAEETLHSIIPDEIPAFERTAPIEEEVALGEEPTQEAVSVGEPEVEVSDHEVLSLSQDAPRQLSSEALPQLEFQPSEVLEGGEISTPEPVFVETATSMDSSPTA